MQCPSLHRNLQPNADNRNTLEFKLLILEEDKMFIIV